jgi:hypothetical protein
LTKTVKQAAPDSPDQPRDCGLIMPISATQNHTEKHWADVQGLLHRGIEQAGLTPANVWEGVNDRISKRIISNIFAHDIVVADISDLNPNVMLELGLRLASRKPTVVVVNKGGSIPFDIGDFEAIPYPADLNILEMEIFFARFVDLLKNRLEVFERGEYQPFLSDVIVEVIQPQERDVGYGDAVLARLDEVMAQISRIDRAPRQLTPSPRTLASALAHSNARLASQQTIIWVPQDTREPFRSALSTMVDAFVETAIDNRHYFVVQMYGDSERAKAVGSAVRSLATSSGGGTDVPPEVQAMLRIP